MASEAAAKVRPVYRAYRRLQPRLRLGGEPQLTRSNASRDKSPKFARIAADHLSTDRMAVLQLWEEVFRL